jgi:uncharacterized protein YcaQ
MALTAQGFNGMRLHEAVGAAQLRKGVDRPGLLQIDSIKVPLCDRVLHEL